MRPGHETRRRSGRGRRGEAKNWGFRTQFGRDTFPTFPVRWGRRRLGELLRETVQHEGGRPEKPLTMRGFH